MKQERDKASTTCNCIILLLSNCLSRLQLLVSSISAYIQHSRPVQFTAKQNIEHPYVCLAVKLVVWLILWSWFIKCGFGAVFFIVSLICFVWVNTNTKPRELGVPSAYSVFNRNCERIDGTFTAEQFEKELRHGALSVHWHYSWFTLLASMWTVICYAQQIQCINSFFINAGLWIWIHVESKRVG